MEKTKRIPTRHTTERKGQTLREMMCFEFTFLFVVVLFCRFILNKKIGVGQPKVMENAKILIANTAMDTDKIKIYGSRVRVDSMNKVRKRERWMDWLLIGRHRLIRLTD